MLFLIATICELLRAAVAIALNIAGIIEMWLNQTGVETGEQTGDAR
jgi:hypothetical protein